YLGLHLHAWVLVEPASRFDINRLSCGESLFEDVAIAVQPQDSIAVVAVEFVYEEAAATEQHVRDAAHSLERVVDALCRGEKLVLPHVKLAAAREVDRHDMARPIATAGNHARSRRLSDEDLHARHHPFETALHGLQGDSNPRVGWCIAACGEPAGPSCRWPHAEGYGLSAAHPAELPPGAGPSQ